MSELSVGIIGAGFFGERHAQAIGASGGIRVAAACRSNTVALDAFVARYGGAPYTDYRSLLADPAVEAVVIATPHHTHHAIAVDALRAGKHVLLEKPLATSITECDSILEAAQASGKVLMPGHVTHFSRAFRTAKAMLDAGELGEVTSGHSTMRKQWMEPNRRDWHLDRARGGGVLLTGGVHAVDRLTWLVGSRILSVSASLATRFHEQSADDSGVLFLRYANGVPGVIFSIGYREGAPEHGTELVCTRGVLRVHSVAGVSIGRGEQWATVPDSGSAAWMDEALTLQWREFAEAISSGRQPTVSGEFARHVMATLFAAQASSEQSGEVRVA